MASSILSPSHALDLKKNAAFATLGACTILINIITLIILIKDRVLFKKSALIVGMVIAGLFASAYVFSVGTHRVVNYEILNISTPVSNCLMIVFPLFYPFTMSGAGIFLLLGAVERLMAITVPIWYHKNWSDKRAWQLSGLAYIAISIFVITGALIALSEIEAPWSCVAATVFGIEYTILLQAISASSGIAGTILSILAMMVGVNKFKKLPSISGNVGRLKKQLRLSRSMVLMSIFNVAFVVVPNIIVILDLLPEKSLPKSIQASQVNYAFCMNTTSTFISLVLFNSQFRKATVKLFRLDKIVVGVSSVLGVVKAQNQVYPTGTDL